MTTYKVCIQWWEVVDVNAESESAALQQVMNMMKPNTPVQVQIVKEAEIISNSPLS